MQQEDLATHSVLLLLLSVDAAGAAEVAGAGNGGGRGERSGPLGALPSGFSLAGELRGSSFLGRSGVRLGSSWPCARASCSAMVVAPLRLADSAGALARRVVAKPAPSLASCCGGQVAPLQPGPVLSSGHS